MRMIILKRGVDMPKFGFKWRVKKKRSGRWVAEEWRTYINADVLQHKQTFPSWASAMAAVNLAIVMKEW